MFPLTWQEWLEKQNKKHFSALLYFSELILHSDARLFPRMSYGAPFIYRYGPIGYFTIDKKDGLYFAFYWGKLLVDFDAHGIFNEDERKMVKLVFLEGREEDEAFLGAFLEILEKALEIDESKYSVKKSAI